MAQIEITGLEKIYDKLRDINSISRHLGPPMQQSMMHLQRRMGQVPRKAAGAFSAMATPRQKRAYWARVRAGVITHDERTGYRRTNTLARKWSFKVKTDMSGVEGTMTNNAPGAVYIQGDRQQPFHRASGWPTVNDTVEKNRKAIQGYFNAAIRRALAK